MAVQGEMVDLLRVILIIFLWASESTEGDSEKRMIEIGANNVPSMLIYQI
jgi:hypothetical protein